MYYQNRARNWQSLEQNFQLQLYHQLLKVKHKTKLMDDDDEIVFQLPDMICQFSVKNSHRYLHKIATKLSLHFPHTQKPSNRSMADSHIWIICKISYEYWGKMEHHIKEHYANQWASEEVNRITVEYGQLVVS